MIRTTNPVKRIKSFIGRLVVASTTLVAINTMAGGLESQLDNIFNGMANVTPTGKYESQMRGVITGGRITAKTKIMNENLINIQTPSFKGGCGGIDMFGGSFSFINADQLVQTMRAVAANAKGYAFQLAMDNMCPQCSATIAQFQEKMQKLNGLMMNSCQLAQGVVNDSASAIANKFDKDLQRTSVSLGTMADDFSSVWQDGQDLSKDLHTAVASNPVEKDKLFGNLVWISMKRNNMTTWFSGGDSNLLEINMSLTGTVIIPAPDDDGQGRNSSAVKPIFKPKLLGLQDLVAGSDGVATFKVYKCGSDTKSCETPSKSNQAITGFKKRIHNFLLEPHNGIIDKVRVGTSGGAPQLTTQQRAFLESMPRGIGGMVVRVARAGASSTDSPFTNEVIDRLAIRMAYDYYHTITSGTIKALQTHESAWTPQAVKFIREARREVDAEYIALKDTYGSLDGTLSVFKEYLSVSERKDLNISDSGSMN